MKKIFFLPLLLFSFLLASASDYYWVGSSGANWGTVSNWKLGSFGGTAATVLPTATDNVFAGNGSGSATITLNINDTINDITIQGSGQIFINTSNSSVLRVEGNLTSSNTSATGGGSATILFAGTNNQSWTGNGSSTNKGKFPNITINKSGGTLSLYDYITMGGSTALTYTAGTISAGTSTVSFYLTNTISGTFSLNNVEFQGNGSSHVVSQTLTVNGDLTLSGSSACVINTGTVELYGNLDDQNSSASSGGTATIKMTGTSNQTYKYPSSNSNGRICTWEINKASGTVTPFTGTTYFTCTTLNIASGDFTAPSGILSVRKSVSGGGTATPFNHSGGTYTHNSGTLEFAVVGNHSIYTIDVLSTTVFYNLVLNGTVSNNQPLDFTTAGSDSIHVANQLTMTDGIFSGLMCVKGNIVVGADPDGGMGVIVLNGSSSVTYTHSTGGRIAQLVIDKSGGATITPAGGTTGLGVSTFNLILGSFTAPSGSFYIGSGYGFGVDDTIFKHVGGSFTHNSGTLLFEEVGNSSLLTLDLGASTTFNNVSLDVFSNNNHQCAFIGAAGDTLRVAGNITFVDGQVSSLPILVEGNVTVQSGFDGGTSPLFFRGSNNQTFDLSSATDKYNGNIILNKASGYVTLSSACTMDASSQVLTLSNGNLVTTSSNLLSLASGVTISGGSATSFISGPIKKTGNIAFTFPTGKSTSYHPIAITAPSSTGDAFTAEYFNSPYASLTLDTSQLTYISTCEYWDLDHTAGSSTVKVTLYWTSTTCDIYTLTTLRVGRYDNSVSKWKAVTTATTTGNTTSGSIQTDNAQSVFGHFAIGKRSPHLYAYAGTDIAVCSGAGGNTIGGSPAAAGGIVTYTYSWSPGTGLSATNVANPTAIPSSNTTYTLTVTDLDHTVQTDAMIVTVNSNPTAAAGSDASLCPVSNSTIGGSPTASGGSSPYTYSWSPSTALSATNTANPVSTATSTITYTVIVTDNNGCTATDAIIITRYTSPAAHAGIDTSVCMGSSAVIGGNPAATSGSSPYTYSWSPSTGLNNPASDRVVSNAIVTTTYILTVTDNHSCTAKDTMVFTVLSLPTANAGSDTAICLGLDVILGGSPAASGGASPYTYSWTPATDLDDDSIAHPTSTPVSIMTYVLIVTDDNGCQGLDSVIVYVPTP